MKVFISWSGARSKEVARAMGELVEAVCTGAKALTSFQIPGGKPWLDELHEYAKVAEAAVVCLTADNTEKRWISYEAGALTQLGVAICPYLIDPDMEAPNLPSPLSNYNATFATFADTKRLLHDIRPPNAEGTPADQDEFEAKFSRHWPDFEKVLRKAQRRSVQHVVDYYERRIKDFKDVLMKFELHRLSLDGTLRDVIDQTLDSNLSDVNYIVDLAHAAIENVREVFHESNQLVGDLREFLTVNFTKSTLEDIIVKKLKPIIESDISTEEKRERLRRSVKIETSEVFFRFYRSLTDKLADTDEFEEASSHRGEARVAGA